MKKIVNGKLYNTETAQFICNYETPGDIGDFYYFEESLYKKKTGEFFLSGHGGPASKYGTYNSYDTIAGGDRITPLSLKEAERWLEKHGDVETYIELFGEPEE